MIILLNQKGIQCTQTKLGSFVQKFGASFIKLIQCLGLGSERIHYKQLCCCFSSLFVAFGVNCLQWKQKQMGEGARSNLLYNQKCVLYILGNNR